MLFRNRINPHRPGNKLSRRSWQGIWTDLVELMPQGVLTKRIDTVRGILTRNGRTLAQGALGWIWARHPRTIPMPGFRNVTQVEDNAGAATGTAF